MSGNDETHDAVKTPLGGVIETPGGGETAELKSTGIDAFANVLTL